MVKKVYTPVVKKVYTQLLSLLYRNWSVNLYNQITRLRERVGTEGLTWWQALYCKENNALMERAHRKETLG